jgi:hypothetical protein
MAPISVRLIPTLSFTVNFKGFTMKNKQSFDDWFDGELCKGGVVFWMALIVACMGFYALIALSLVLGG